jgi:hypothetical protein
VVQEPIEDAGVFSFLLRATQLYDIVLATGCGEREVTGWLAGRA